jgi:membrane protein YdbS with pleckstrin-like domain
MVAGLLALADREPRLLFALVMLFCCFEVFVVGAIAILAEWLFAAVTWWTIITANALATLMMAGYLFLAHRRLVRDFLTADD